MEDVVLKGLLDECSNKSLLLGRMYGSLVSIIDKIETMALGDELDCYTMQDVYKDLINVKTMASKKIMTLYYNGANNGN